MISRSMLLGATALTLLAGTAVAQDAAGPRWDAFAGCWAPVFVEGTNITAELPRLCVIPGAGAEAEVVAVVDGKTTERKTLFADGTRRDIAEAGCAGWESARWSADGRRLYLQGEQECGGGVRRATSSIFSLTAEGDWLSVNGVRSGDGGGTRAVRYSPAVSMTGIPADVAAALTGREMARSTARLAASASVSFDNVIEASRAVDSSVVAGWLTDRGQPFPVDASALRRLKMAELPESIIDVMVAVSHPKHFAFALGGSATVERSAPARNVDGTMLAAERLARLEQQCDGFLFDPYGYNYARACDPLMRYGLYGVAGYSRYSPFNNRSDPYGYGYGSYGSYGGSGYYGRPVTIIVRGSSEDPASHGVVDRNRGYRQGTSSGTTSSPAPRSTGGASGASSGTEPGSSGSSGSSGGTSGTAKPRPPGGQ